MFRKWVGSKHTVNLKVPIMSLVARSFFKNNQTEHLLSYGIYELCPPGTHVEVWMQPWSDSASMTQTSPLTFSPVIINELCWKWSRLLFAWHPFKINYCEWLSCQQGARLYTWTGFSVSQYLQIKEHSGILDRTLLTTTLSLSRSLSPFGCGFLLDTCLATSRM